MQLNAGPIQLTYKHGFLRTLTVNGDEVLRMIYFALRDRDWNTARITITDESIHSEAESFVVDYNWQVDDLGIQMRGKVHIEGQPGSNITVDFYGNAVNTFWRNRVGLCILHPIEGISGQPCLVEHPDGRTTHATFPNLISPHQPFLKVQGMTWQMTSGQPCTLAFAGDIFETEDQRNWTDASYKTYSMPLDRPFPVEVPVGAEIRQTVSFQPVFQPVSSPQPVSSQDITHQQKHPAKSQTETRNAPIRVGLGHRIDGPPLTATEADRLKRLGLSHLRADVLLHQNDWQTHVKAAKQEADLLNVSLELALFFGSDAAAEAEQFARFAQEYTLLIYALSLFQATTGRTADALLNQAIPVFRRHLPGVFLGGGTDANFVELNRHRFDFSQVDFITYSINPQVHAFDDQTLMENVAAQADTVRSARELSGGKPVHVSPVTLLPRFNPDAPPRTGRGRPPADPRLSTEFGAEWTRRSLQTLTQAGAASMTYFETHGPRGLMNEGDAYPVLDVFRRFR